MPVRLSTTKPVDKAAEKRAIKAEVAPIRSIPVATTHLNLAVYVQMHPHAARMWKQSRRLPPIKRSKAAEMYYRGELLRLVRVLKSNTAKYLMPELLQDYREQSVGLFVGDAAKMQTGARARAALSDSRRRVQNIDAVAEKLTNVFIKRALRDVDDRLTMTINRSLGVNIRPAFTSDGPIRDKVRAATEANVALIKSIPEQYHDEIDKLVTENYQRGTRFQGMEASIKELGNVTDRRAHLIARDQTSKLNSSFNMARQMSIGIEEYEWQGVDDERERETHVENNGKVFRWDSPPEETGHPGDDVNCRCDAAPVFNFDQLEADAEE